MVLLQLSAAPSLFRRGRRKTHFFLLCPSPSPPPSSSIVAKHLQYRSNQAFHGSSAPSPPCFFSAKTLIRARKSLIPAEKNIVHKNKTLTPIQALEGERAPSFTEEIMLLNGELIVNEDDGGDGSGYGEMHNKPEEKHPLNPNANKILTLPTLLTLARVASIPVLLCVFYSTEWWATTTVTCIFVLAAATDWLDGFLARKMGSNSAFGAFLDPVADKLMVATTLVLLCTKPIHVSWAAGLPWLIPVPSTAIIGREITMSAVREWAASQGEDLQAAVAVNNLGKWKTASQLIAITTLLTTRSFTSEAGIAYLLVGVGVTLLYISAGLALWSLVVYMKSIWETLIK